MTTLLRLLAARARLPATRFRGEPLYAAAKRPTSWPTSSSCPASAANWKRAFAYLRLKLPSIIEPVPRHAQIPGPDAAGPQGTGDAGAPERPVAGRAPPAPFGADGAQLLLPVPRENWHQP